MTTPTSMSASQLRDSNSDLQGRRVHVIAAIRGRAGLQAGKKLVKRKLVRKIFERAKSPNGAASDRVRAAVDVGRLASRSNTNQGTEK